MKLTNRKFLVAGLLASTLTFVGCQSARSAERTGTPGPPQTTRATGTGTECTCTPTPCGTGGSGTFGQISTTKQSDDNLRMPEDDPLRLKSGDKRVRAGESEQGVHEGSAVQPESGTGGSGCDTTDDNLHDGENVDDTLRIPDSPSHGTTPDSVTNDSQRPEGAR